MNNNVRHSVGDKVVALGEGKHPYQPVNYLQTYLVKDVRYCTKCGKQAINVGFNAKLNYEIDCGSCGNTSTCQYKYWTCSEWFAPLSEIGLQSAVEEENYELAAIIRDALKETEKC